MLARIRLRPYKQGSRSAMALARYLRVKMIKLEDSQFMPRSRDTIINWGNSSSYYEYPRIINHPSAVAIASNKLKTFHKLDENSLVNIPDYCLHKDNIHCLNSDKVVVRHTLTGHSGQGIEVYKKTDELPDAPLYTQFISKKNEYRIIVVNGRVVDRKQKRLSQDAPEGRSKYIRNASNGWIYAREGLEYTEGLDEMSIEAVKTLGLDFGAVDIALSNDGLLYVFEVNTAFGLEGTTIQLVGDAIRRML